MPVNPVPHLITSLLPTGLQIQVKQSVQEVYASVCLFVCPDTNF